MAPTTSSSRSETGAPPIVRRTACGLLLVALAGAAYLITVRGEAIIVDLSTLAGKVWCF